MSTDVDSFIYVFGDKMQYDSVALIDINDEVSRSSAEFSFVEAWERWLELKPVN
ncbi:hypothetical protein [Methylobacterium sp. 77]|uniref:hypothetical protein n=1 Tax=Methylobacterium sp. 77 TaxID=1101192 RepID=UPI00037D7459|nr:hypothetical protein [Methylobacterium sp. 77]